MTDNITARTQIKTVFIFMAYNLRTIINGFIVARESIDAPVNDISQRESNRIMMIGCDGVIQNAGH